MKKFLLLFLLAFTTIMPYGQSKLILQKGLRRVRIKPALSIGMITNTNSLPYHSSLWKIDSVLPEHLILKKPDRYEYRTVSYKEAVKMLDSEWTFDTTARDQPNQYGSSKYNLKKPLTYNYKRIDYNEILTVQYAQSEDQSGCIGCIFFPIMVIAAPFAGWGKGKFYPEIFIPVFSIGVGASWLIFNSFKRREVKNYKIGKWTIHTK